jgi:hypothetical protein
MRIRNKMDRIFVNMKYFEKCWKELGLNDYDLKSFQEFLLEKPDRGDLIKKTGGVRKIRLDLPKSNKGKSGGIRVLYIDFEFYEKIYLLLAFPKSKKENISDKVKNEIRIIVKEIAKQLEKNYNNKK